jgi:Zn-dependent peptidase ImmA (M78 family)
MRLEDARGEVCETKRLQITGRRDLIFVGEFFVKISAVQGITPSVLRWARESVNMSPEDVAGRLKKTVATIEAWESGDGAPSYAQLESLAYDIYKRPIAIFFLPKPPAEPKLRTEFRSLPDVDIRELSRDTTLLIRKARAFQLALVELHGGKNPMANPIWREVKLVPNGNVAEQALRVRSALGVDFESIRQQPDTDRALKLWRRAIERSGVYVFKDTFKQSELSGFCLSHPEFPVVLINNSTTKTRQVFSLLHELAHILCERNGISRFDNRGIDALAPVDRGIEKFCNQLAGEILVPLSEFRIASNDFLPAQASDDDFAKLALRYHVSRSVILRRLVELGRATNELYLLKDKQWSAQRKSTDSGGNYYATQGAYLSEQFLREVVSRYSRRLLTKNEAADLIGVKPRNFEQFEELAHKSAAA